MCDYLGECLAIDAGLGVLLEVSVRVVPRPETHITLARKTTPEQRRRLGLALDLLNDPVLDRLVTGEGPFDTLPGTLASLAGTPDDTLCHRIVYT